MNESVSNIDLVNIFSSVASIVLALVALALSIYFYRQSVAEAKQSEKSAGEISSSVAKLEKLFDTLYSDTFSMMKDTVTDMRQHVWTKSDTGIAVQTDTSADDGPVAGLVERLETLVAKIDSATESSNGAVQLDAQALKQIGELVEQAASTWKPPASQSISGVGVKALLRERLSKARGGSTVPLERLVKFAERLRVSEVEVVNALFAMRSAGEIEWDGSAGTLKPNTQIRLVEQGSR
ncbi:hypothetical protein IDH50_15915 [Aeromicrobium tamlense]|uniref:Methyl-accepting chemotaxis protein n=1 Tax=Aeromicrobium tamlense TaxID=375541 RepID=A0A8I0KI58_9ACTN|nr:hypothetical protein [Aeromicrobium tamlense]MBD1271731.1 hypothetical protein [Aeromicrobium tamlense]NYI37521.1 methyl-accepting chemotaxis protein [Aeromicrobium tamlense]